MEKITDLVNLDHRYVRTGEQLKKSKERIKASWSWLHAGNAPKTPKFAARS
jgi:hypothetical protein